MPWRPGVRAAERLLESPYDDVPAHLEDPLLRWLLPLIKQPGVMEVIALDFRVTITNPHAYSSVALDEIANMCRADSDFLLDLVEWVLERFDVTGSACQELRAILHIANSVYTVRADNKGLEVRTTPAVRDQVQAVVDRAVGSAGDHLAEAWNRAYGRTPDAVKSYSEAIKAAEAALAPRITPQNNKQTLGTMIADVRQAPQNFKFAIQDGTNSDGVQTVLAMMRQLWEGQTSRHGGTGQTRPETVDEAQAAVHIAAGLVEWGVSGAFARR